MSFLKRRLVKSAGSADKEKTLVFPKEFPEIYELSTPTGQKFLGVHAKMYHGNAYTKITNIKDTDTIDDLYIVIDDDDLEAWKIRPVSFMTFTKQYETFISEREYIGIPTVGSVCVIRDNAFIIKENVYTYCSGKFSFVLSGVDCGRVTLIPTEFVYLLD